MNLNLCNFFLTVSQGHAAPALYSMWVETGFLKESDLLSLCQVDSTLEGHPNPVSCHILYHTSGIIPLSTASGSTTTLHSNNNHDLCAFQKQQFVDVTIGSLGQGLGVACGMAYTGKYFDKSR